MIAAYWSVLIAALMPLLFTGIAKFGGGGFNNRRPRTFQDGLTGWRQRAHWAHLNGLEAFPVFAAAVCIAGIQTADVAVMNGLAITWIVFRLVYGALYISDHATLRSLAWAGALACVIGLFLAAAGII